MKHSKVFDIIGIGIGPFNLGLAALVHMIPDLSAIFFDQSECFDWHPGLMINGATLQVPFYADLVTLADPCSPFNYFAFLKAQQRLFRFAINEQYFPTRKEYNQYCKWVAGQLPNLRFGKTCEAIYYDEYNKTYRVEVRNNITQQLETFYAKNVVLGIGSVPAIPAFAKNVTHPGIIHSANYLPNKGKLLGLKSITIVGSGQSAAEIFYDLLPYREELDIDLHWFTRSERFYPMEYSKFTLEMTSPDYIQHFYRLNPHSKKSTLSGQDSLYKGINFDLLTEIYSTLYTQHINRQTINDQLSAHPLHPNCELRCVDVFKETALQLGFHHTELQQPFTHITEAVVLATGYKQAVQNFIAPIREYIRWDASNKNAYNANSNYSIDAGNSLFIQNAEKNTHGFNAADLGMGPFRNAIILNTILKREHFIMEKQITFQEFGLPDKTGYS